MRRAIQRVTPDLSRQRVMMNRLKRVMTTGWLRPEMALTASSGVSRVAQDASPSKLGDPQRHRDQQGGHVDAQPVQRHRDQGNEHDDDDEDLWKGHNVYPMLRCRLSLACSG